MVSKRRMPEPAPETLMQAHDMLVRVRPSRDAPGDAWVKYYRRSAAVYADVAEVDRGHHHEAMYWANREQRKANELQAKLAKELDPPVVEKVTERGSDTTVHTKQ